MELEKLREAGRIAGKVRDASPTIVKVGVSLLEATEKLEQMIYSLGGAPAFPVTLSVNENAAHQAADIGETYVFKADDVVKVDIGVHIDGHIGDTATTIDLSGKYKKLLEASSAALHDAISIVKPGTTLGDIGKAIEDAIVSRGFEPIRNLSGHGLDLYTVHTKPSIPNYDTGSKETLKEGQVIAIEPFASTGAGMIKNTDTAVIYEQISERQVRSMLTRKVYSRIKRYNGLPFNYRWLTREFPESQVRFAIKDLMANGILTSHPPLPDVEKGIVSQHEHSLLITKDGCEILTK